MKGRIDTVSRIIVASPSALYQAFMDPDLLVQWLPPEGMTGQIEFFRPEVGEGYRMTLTYKDTETTLGKTSVNTDTFETTFLERVPDKKIAGSSVFETEDPDVVGKLIMAGDFEEVDKCAKVTLIAENVPVGISKDAHIEGLNSTLDNLANFVKNEQVNTINCPLAILLEGSLF